MEAGKTRNSFETFHHTGTRIERLLPRAPRLQRCTRHAKRLGSLTLGDPLGLQVKDRMQFTPSTLHAIFAG
jgi:hypothetical protein